MPSLHFAEPSYWELLLPGMASTLASTYAPVETRPAVQVASKTLSKHGKFSTTNVFKLAGTAAAAPVDGVVTVVKSIEEAASLHMWQQGDEEMYTLQHVQERFFNRFHPEVVQLLSSVWWPTALRGLPIEGWDGDTLRTWSMPQRNHALMIVKLCRALLEPGEPWDAAEAERFACTAWEEDTKGTHVLNRIRFCDSIFEVADIWTLSTEADEYVAFLRRLMDAVGEPPQGWKCNEDIVSVLGDRFPSKAERAKRIHSHKQRTANVHIQAHARRMKQQKIFKKKRASAIKIQAQARRKQASFSGGVHVLDMLHEKKTTTIALAMPDRHHASRYLLPKPRPPTRLLDRQKQANIGLRQTRSLPSLDRAQIVYESPEGRTGQATKLRLRRARTPKLHLSQLAAPIGPLGVMRYVDQVGNLRVARNFMEVSDFVSPRRLAPLPALDSPIGGILGGFVSPPTRLVPLAPQSAAPIGGMHRSLDVHRRLMREPKRQPPSTAFGSLYSTILKGQFSF